MNGAYNYHLFHANIKITFKKVSFLPFLQAAWQPLTIKTTLKASELPTERQALTTTSKRSKAGDENKI